MATLTDINNKLDALEIDKENIRQAIISKDVNVPSNATVSSYGDYIRQINPDLELDWIMGYSRDRHDFVLNDLRIDLGIKFELDCGYYLYGSPFYNLGRKTILSNNPYTESSLYPDYYLNYAELVACNWESFLTQESKNHEIIYSFPSIDSSVNNAILLNTYKVPDSSMDPSTSVLRPTLYVTDSSANDDFLVFFSDYSITLQNLTRSGPPSSYSTKTRSIEIEPVSGDSLIGYNIENSTNLYLDLNPSIETSITNKSISIRRGYSQKFRMLRVYRNGTKIHEYTPYIRFNASTGKYDTFVLKDKHDANYSVVLPNPRYKVGQSTTTLWDYYTYELKTQ